MTERERGESRGGGKTVTHPLNRASRLATHRQRTFVGRFAHSEAAAPTDAQKAVYQAALLQNKQAGEEMRRDWTRRAR